MGENYLALYRKYRPKKFCDVIGQENITRTLVNQIKLNRISHAYLFCGTRGTGKTSVAKIFAMALNCFENENSGLGEPCLNCQSCQDILSKKDMNVIEIDAASNNGVDNIREIRDEVKYPPVKVKYKIYIVDEVHMLSSGAFNALLKTLEEPPEHVIFILATTEPQKIPVTIISRCQKFDFKRIEKEKMLEALKKYMTLEKINIDDEALNYIIYLSDGAMRDALSLLDQVTAFYFENKIDLAKVMEITGTMDDNFCCEFLNCFFDRNINKILDMISQIVFDGKEISQFVYNLILFLRESVILNKYGGENKVLNLWESRFNSLKKCKLDFDTQMLLIEMFLRLHSSLKYAVDGKVLFETECMKFFFDMKNNYVNREFNYEFKNKTEEKSVDNKKVVENKIDNNSGEENKIKIIWDKICQQTDGLMKEILLDAKIKKIEDNIIFVQAANESKKKLLDERKNEIKKLLAEISNGEIDIDKFGINFVYNEDADDSNKKNIFEQENFSDLIKKINMDVKIED